MADTFILELVTPARRVVREAVNEAQIPVRGGYIGVLPGHTPLLAKIGVGELSFRAGNATHFCTAIGGFVEVLSDRVIVLADHAERAEEIDVARAEAARNRAQKRLATPNDPNLDWNRAQSALERALVRLQIAPKRGAARNSDAAVTHAAVAHGDASN